ncbi:MAG: phosphomannose isomerase type II C-terminal cupin domain [Candidatus Thermoplasmatota archaeon]|nr:phosphomannose isomerase type II C-terminal cupin domain [Candidatus Thermoplasmatota archaeon]
MKEDRPWGVFTVLDEEKGFKVKVIEVLPGKRLSYQSHSGRSERWVIVQGEAEVTLDGHEDRYSRGEVVEIGIGQKHRVSNPGATVLKIVEVQLGDYLGEDDIKRYDDDFGRI